jgi:hypothetical protein
MKIKLTFFIVTLMACTSLFAGDQEDIQKLFPEATSVDRELWMKAKALPDPADSPSSNHTLTWFFTFGEGMAEENSEAYFEFIMSPPNPADFSRAMEGKEVVSLVQAEYITECTCDVSGEEATGTVTYEAPKVYKGTFDYHASKTTTGWKIDRIMLPKLGVTLTRSDDGSWAMTRDE